MKLIKKKNHGFETVIFNRGFFLVSVKISQAFEYILRTAPCELFCHLQKRLPFADLVEKPGL